MKPGAAENERTAFVTPILEAKGWSLLDWAVHAGVDWHTTSGYANGKTMPYRSTRLKLATSLGISVHDLPQ